LSHFQKIVDDPPHETYDPHNFPQSSVGGSFSGKFGRQQSVPANPIAQGDEVE
jgi:hypothetical protein